MAPGVPGDGGDAVTELDAVAIQPLRDFQRAGVNFGVSVAAAMGLNVVREFLPDLLHRK